MMPSRRDQLLLFGHGRPVGSARADRREVRRLEWASEILSHEGEDVS
jgi:hypothetical protein